MFEKMLPMLDNLVDKLIGSEEAKSAESSDVFGEKKPKYTAPKTVGYGQLARKVWVNGKLVTAIANSPEELTYKLEKLDTPKLKLEDLMLDKADPLLFSSLYTEEIPNDMNDWSEKRDVWIDEYCPV